MKMCNCFDCLKKLTADDKVKILSVVTALLGGIIIGFMMAPIKKGIYCGNNNGNNNGNTNCEEDCWEIEE